jgi:hypothetical protein
VAYDNLGIYSSKEHGGLFQIMGQSVELDPWARNFPIEKLVPIPLHLAISIDFKSFYGPADVLANVKKLLLIDARSN